MTDLPPQPPEPTQAIVADWVAFSAVPTVRDDRVGERFAGRAGVLFAFALSGAGEHAGQVCAYQPMLYLGPNPRGLAKTLRAAIADLPPEGDEKVRCPGCNVQLHGHIAVRGACTACFPTLPADA